MLPESEEERRGLWVLMKDVQENAQPSVVTPGKWLESWPSGTFSCLDCGGKVSWKSEKCVHCGNPKAREDLEYKLRQEFGDFTRGVKGAALVQEVLSQGTLGELLKGGASKAKPESHPLVATYTDAELKQRLGFAYWWGKTSFHHDANLLIHRGMAPEKAIYETIRYSRVLVVVMYAALPGIPAVMAGPCAWALLPFIVIPALKFIYDEYNP